MIDKDPVGRHGVVISRDLLTLTPDQEKLRELVDGIGQRTVAKTVVLEQPEQAEVS